jgi:hypothetical protein
LPIGGRATGQHFRENLCLDAAALIASRAHRPATDRSAQSGRRGSAGLHHRAAMALPWPVPGLKTRTEAPV